MTPSEDTPGLIGLSRIAQLAGVRPSAVSNWRRRYKDFPAPKAGSGRQIMFDLDEVEAWLLANEKIEERIPPRQRFFASLEAARAIDTTDLTASFCTAALVYLTACRRAEEQNCRIPVRIDPGDLWASIQQAPQVMEHLAAASQRIESANECLRGLLAPLASASTDIALSPEGLGLVNSLDALLDSGIKTEEILDLIEGNQATENPRKSGQWTTPDSLIRLATALAPERADSVLDPAAGSGRLLAQISKKVAAEEIVGLEMSEEAVVLLRQRFFLADTPAELSQTNSLQSQEWAQADLVVVDPPLGAKQWGRPEDYGSSRWEFGPIPPSSADMAWVELTCLSLKGQGTGMVFTPQGPLFRGGLEGQVRKSMVEAGVVEAIISLPPSLLSTTAIPLALWLLRSTADADPGSPVLMVDGSDLGFGKRPPYTIPEESIQKIATIIREWRDKGEISEESKRSSALVLVRKTGVKEEIRDIAVAVPLEQLDRNFSLVPINYLLPQGIDTERLRERHREMSQDLAEHSALKLDPGLLVQPKAGNFEERRLGEVARIIRGRTRIEPEEEARERHGRQMYENRGHVRRVPKPDVETQSLDLTLLKARHGFWGWEGISSDALRGDEERAKPGDVAVFIGQRDPMATIIEDWPRPVIPAMGIWLIRSLDTKLLSPRWIERFILSQQFWNQVRLFGKPSAFGPRLSLADFENVRIPIPALGHQVEIAEQSERLRELAEEAKAAASAAQGLGDTLFDLATARNPEMGEGTEPHDEGN